MNEGYHLEKRKMVESEGLSQRQEEYMKFIKSYYDQYNEYPTYQQIATQLNKSLSSIHEMVQRLKEKGYIKKTYSTRLVVEWDGNARSLKDFKEYLKKRIKDKDILHIINSY